MTTKTTKHPEPDLTAQPTSDGHSYLARGRITAGRDSDGYPCDHWGCTSAGTRLGHLPTADEQCR